MASDIVRSRHAKGPLHPKGEDDILPKNMVQVLNMCLLAKLNFRCIFILDTTNCFYLIKWCRRKESNLRPRPYQGRALPLSYGGSMVSEFEGAQHDIGGTLLQYFLEIISQY